MRLQQAGALVERRGERRLVAVQVARHPGELGALAGVHEGHRPLLGDAGEDLLGGPALQVSLQVIERGGSIVGQDGQPVAQMAASRRRSAGELPEAGLRIVEDVAVAAGEPLQSRAAAGGDDQHARAVRVARPVLHGSVDGGRLRQNDVGVGAAEAERADRGVPGTVDLGPRLRRGGHGEGGPLEGDVRVEAIEVQVRRHDAVLQREDGLDEARHTGGRLEVADGRLGRAEEAAFGPVPVDRGQRLHLDGVAQGRTGAVALDELDIAGPDAATLERLADARRLRGGARGGEAGGAAVLVHRVAHHQGEHGIAVAACVGQSLEHHDARPLTAHASVAELVERAGPPVARHHPEGGEGDGRQRRHDDVDAPAQSDVALAGAQRLAGLMDGDQRRRAGGVDGQRRTLQIQHVADPARHDAVCGPAAGVGRDVGGVAGALGGEVGTRHAHVDAGTGTGQHVSGELGVLQRQPGGFQGDPLLGIHRLRLAAGDPEEGVVEGVEIIQEPAPTGAGLARRSALGVVVRRDVEAPPGDFGDGIDTVAEPLPVGVGAFRAREPASHADHRDRLGRGGAPQFGHLRLERPDRAVGLLEGVAGRRRPGLADLRSSG